MDKEDSVKKLDICYSEGAVAFEYGANSDYNHYTPGSPEYKAWQAGYDDAAHNFKKGQPVSPAGIALALLVLIIIVLLGSLILDGLYGY